MKTAYFILWSFLVFYSTKSSGNNPIDFDLCIDTPNNLNDFIDCNNVIARMYAPVIYQWMTHCTDNSEGGDSDRILKVNFDDDWVADNNWSTVEDLRDNSSYENRPHGYYAVVWTENFWLITYSFYYARDHAKDALCTDDEHEGDVTKIFVVVERPESVNDDFRDLLKGYATHKDNVDCIDLEQEGDSHDEFNAIIGHDLNEVDGIDGIYPLVSSAAGSHYQYKKYTQGFYDDGNGCKVRPTAITEYLPAWNNIPSDLTELEFPSGCGCPAPVGIFLIESCRFETEHYGLIDLFDEEEGLWEQRTNSEMFNYYDEPHNFDRQKFRCDNGGGCSQPFASGAPGAPWKGNTGMYPLLAVKEKFNNSFCDGTSVEDCHYLYNPQLCGQYKIFMQPTMLNDEGEHIPNPSENSDGFIMRLKFGIPPYYPIRPDMNVIWTFTLPDDISMDDIECIGCDEKSSVITLIVSDAVLHYGNFGSSEIFIVHAVTEKPLLECNQNEGGAFSFETVSSALVTNTTCDQTTLEIKPEYHQANQTYEWIFLGYDNLATFSNGNKNVAFSTAQLKQYAEDQGQVEPTVGSNDDPPQFLPYAIKVKDVEEEVEIDQLYGIIILPQCDEDKLGLVLYPNPSTDLLHLHFTGLEKEQQKNFDFTIVDHQLNLVRKINCPSIDGTIDVSDLDAGLYYLYTVTDKGQTLSKKFCVGH